MTEILTLPEPDLMVARPADAPTVYPYQRAVDAAIRQAIADILLKAPIASPTFTGDPKAPTPATSDSDTSLATTAFVQAAISSNSKVLQVLQTTYAANSSITTVLPLDDTVPTNTEGDEVLSQVITPASASNTILAKVSVFGSQAAASGNLGMAMFRGSTCINASGHSFPSANFPAHLTMEVIDSPAAASPVTYSVRVGPGAAGTIRLNGSTAGRHYGGAAKCTLTLMEIKG